MKDLPKGERFPSFKELKVVIENPKGSYKSFDIEGDFVWEKYPLTGVVYPVDYGYIDGYTGEDGHDLDVFVGSGNLFGFIKIWRMDVPEETKILAKVTQEELDQILQTFSPALLSHTLLTEQECMEKVAAMRSSTTDLL